MNDVISSVIRNSQVFTKNYSPETGPIHFAYPFISYPLPIPSFSSMIMIDYHQYRIPLDYLPYQPCICSYFKKISFFCRSKMGLLAQIGLLFWKDLLIITRSKIWIICEILFSLLLLPYIILLVKYVPEESKKDAYSFEPFSISGNSSDIDRQINNSATIDRYYNCNHDILLGYSYEAGLATYANSLMNKLRERYLDNETDMQIGVHEFANFTEMKNDLENDLNKTIMQMCGEYIGGIHFSNILLRKGKQEPQLVYRILLPQRTHATWSLTSFWLDNDPNARQADLNQIPRNPPYWQSGFLSIQFALESSFLEMNGDGAKIFPFNKSAVSFLRIPIDETRDSGVLLFLKFMHIFWLLAVIGIMLHTAKNIVLEKEAGIKAYMSVMGLHPMAFYYTHILVGFLKSSLVMILCTGILCIGLKYTSTTVFVFFAIIFGLSMVILSAFISTVVKTPQLIQFLANFFPLALLALTLAQTPSVSQICLCILTSLNPITAFRLGVAHITNYETRMLDLGWLSIFSGSTQQFTLGWAMIMLIFDSTLFSFLIYYLDSVLPTDDSPKRHPLFFFEAFGIKIFSQHISKMPEDQTDSKVLNENMEQEHGSLDEADIIVNHMSKQWSGGNLAVDNLNFRAYRGQLTVLLGHNGAGKTTTFSVISGTISSSAGQVLICGKDLNENLRDCQKQMGYCPQNNPLFDKLTVKEHLKLYAGLKTGRYYGPAGKQALEQEIIHIVEDVGLTPKIDTQAQNLSGGQKRKLCVAISLIAQSKVVLLDEPTAGMDPEARNEVGKLLDRVKKDRTILLTTHYMEEADKLGDRIGIMANGRLMCNGSPEFLKNKFGTGYILSVVCSGFDSSQRSTTTSSDDLRLFHQIINRILGVIRKYSPTASIDKAHRPPEFAVILPTTDKRHYANLFEELENGKILLGIRSFGLSLNTLEQVFLKVGELAVPDDDKDEVDGPIGERKSTQQIAKDLFGVRQQQFVNTYFNNICLWFGQIASLLHRHFLWTIRNPMRSFIPLAIAVLSFIGLGLSFRPSSTPNLNQHRELSLNTAHESMRIPMQFQGGKQVLEFQKQLEKLSKRACSNCIITIDQNKDLHTELKKQLLVAPPMVAGMAIYENASTAQYTIEILFNGVAIHSPPMALSFLTNAMLGVNTFAITPTIEVYDIPTNPFDDDDPMAKLTKGLLNNMSVAAIIIMCFAIFGATMVVPLVEERSGKFKHQLMLTKLHVATYWISIFLSNLIFYLIYCSILAIFLIIFGWMENCRADLFLLWALYFWSYVPMNSVVSFIFDKGQRAFSAVLSWNLVASLLFLMASSMLKYVIKWNNLAHTVDTLLYLLTPAYALGSGVFKILIHSFGMHMHDDKNEWYLKEHVELMLLSGFLFWSILAILQSRVLATKFHKISCQLFHYRLYKRIQNHEWDDEAQEDPDVRKERERLERHEAREFALAVRNLTKYYGTLPAVKNLTFGVKKEECFGLLGVNGAGKTTTFDILTGIRFATSGCATIEGVNVNKAPAIGYCPQFDALPMELTGREVLTLLARLNGFSNIKTRIDRILWCIRMDDQADKKVMHYSGGQRRRISIGTTLVTRSSLIMLDEPTAGIDPITRRQIWQLLQAIRQQGIAILLTSHSMDECEELCNKIAFMNQGTLIGIGSSQHLKTRFGNSYMLAITISNPGEGVFYRMNQLVMEIFDAKQTEDLPTSNSLHWEIPKKDHVTWSVLYKKAQSLADSYQDTPNFSPGSDTPKIMDFSLTQNSLEQVFLRLSQIGESTPPPTQEIC